MRQGWGALLAGLAALAVAAAEGAAAEPRSAIPWLSESLRTTTPAVEPAAAPGRLAPLVEGEITVTPLDDVALDAVGILEPDETGFARTMWTGTPARRARALILHHPEGGVPEARALFRRILLAAADPPAGARAGEVLVARIDRLMAMGSLGAAEALLEQAGAETPELFRRLFDVGLLLDRAEPACQALKRNPALSPTLPARIFCLARDGDWNAAEITLTLGAEVGELTRAEAEALGRFLDPELFEHVAPPDPPEPFTPLDFLLREAVGLPRPAGALPPAFLHHDLADYMPMRARIQAAERLVLEGAVAPEVLWEAYRAGRPAASGGFWDRAAAVQALDAALADGEDPQAIGAALVAADAALAARGLRVALAAIYAEPLTALEAEALPGEARRVLVELLLLGEAYAAAAVAAGAEPDPRTRRLLALAGRGERADEAAAAAPALERAALAGLNGGPPPEERAARLLALLEAGREGEMLLEALALLAEGPQVDPPSLRAALYALRRAGQEPAARRIALQTLLAPGERPS